MNENSILFILPSFPEPRNENIINKVKTISKTTVLYWEKENNKTQYRNIGVNVNRVLIPANNHNPLKRLFPTIRYFRTALDYLITNEPTLIHVSKIDSMLVVWYYKSIRKHNATVVYDVSDMHPLAYNDSKKIVRIILRKVLCLIEKMVSKSVDALLVTSPRFYDDYYSAFYKKDKVVFIPNAPDTSCFKNYSPHRGDFTIGFIGSIRYPKQMKELMDVSEELGIKVIIAGDGVDEKELREYAHNKKYENVLFWGRYNYKKEIAIIYSMVDCLYVLYDTRIKNVRVALPNKLYEGALCGIPFIVSKGVYLADLVEEFGLGYSVTDGNKGELRKIIELIRHQDKKIYEERGKEFMKDNSFDKKCEQLINIYKRILC